MLHHLTPNQPIRLADMPTNGKTFYDGPREAAEAEFQQLRDDIITWQERLYAEGRQKLLLIFQAMDGGGKDGTIKALLRGVNPQGVKVTAFKQPTSYELAHDFLWRVHQAVPSKGFIGVFNRSHYEDVLIVRVDNIAPESVWRPRYDRINQFEQLLAESGTTILKFYLHISKEEQAKRFQARIDDPSKHWKFSFEDLEKRKQWADYMAAYEEMLNQCSTPHAPWYLIPANQKWYRNLAVARITAGTLAKLNPQYPAGTPNLTGLQVT